MQGSVVEGEVRRLIDAPEARGVAGGHRVRVRGGVPLDRGTFRVVHAGRNAVWVQPHELSRPSPFRVEAPCPVVHRCGGCPWQMVRSDAQRAAREGLLYDTLGDLVAGATRHPWAPADSRETPSGYRTRALMMLRHVGGSLRAGFFEPGTNTLVPAESCLVQHPILTPAIDGVRAVLEAAQLSSWRGADRPGLLRAMLLRVDPSEPAGALVTLIVSRDDERFDAITPDLLGVPGVTGAFLSINERPGGAILGDRLRHLGGARRQPMRFGELELLVGPTAFVQTRHEAAEALLDTVGTWLPDRMDHLADVYSGVGVFGLALAGRARRVTLVESSADACADATFNVARLGLSGAAVLNAPAARGLEILSQAADRPDAVILDPPRAGCGKEVVAALAAMDSVRTLVYVSCHPRALARDLVGLLEAGFVATDVRPIDMFPHTPHVEVAVRLARPKRGS